MPARETLCCNARMAVALLEILTESGDGARYARALRELGGDPVTLLRPGMWLARATLDAAFVASDLEPRVARRVGRAIVTPESLGASLYAGGLATVEKAYRRCNDLLAREDGRGHYEAVGIANGKAQIVFHPGAAPDPELEFDLESETKAIRARALYCGVREGMLGAVPLCFGLLPAQVRETQCVAKGATHCSYEVEWSTGARKGIALGAAAGMLIGGAGAWAYLASYSPWVAGAGAIAALVLGASLGRSTDLARQLRAVAGARRGQLALLDQTDRSIAEKMDELAKIEASLDSARTHRGGPPAAPRGAADVEREDRLLAVRASQEIYGALGPLQRGLGEIREEIVDSGIADQPELDFDGQRVEDALHRCTDESRRIQGVGAELARATSEEGKIRQAVSLAEVVTRAVDTMRPTLAREIELELELEEALAPVRCEPFQMEQVVYQLLRNALEATGLSGRIGVAVRGRPEGIELVVEDAGGGFSEESLDEVFDPFAASGAAGNDGGLGLAICYRVVEEHGGEMSVASRTEGGTQVTIVLPADLLERRSRTPRRAGSEPEG